MKIVFVTLLDIEDINERGIYTDLVREIAENGIDIYVVSPSERRKNKPTRILDFGKIKILKVKTGNIVATRNFIEKGISTLLLEYQYLSAIKKFFKNEKFDMVLYSTPPVTLGKVIKYIKKKNNCVSYLILKDIFPQNAVDIGLIKKDSFLYKYFRNKEIKLYKLSDYIGCMSKANVEYLLSHNSFLTKEKVEIFPNCIKPIKGFEISEDEKKALREELNLPKDKILFVYGGNLGKPQGPEFIMEVIKHFEDQKDAFFLIVGFGTEYEMIKSFLETNNIKNTKILPKFPKDQYDKLLLTADVGLVFLDNRFTIPNFPSRLTSYMEFGLPVLAATDRNTDVKGVIKEGNFGLWCESSDIQTFMNHIEKLTKDENLRKTFGSNARKYLEEHYDVSKNIFTILKHLKNSREMNKDD